ncbi:DUF397 domain-containing protein [Actinomadura harenae]|uniref:DUF397 domain-containing protein n=1 Tax=Actinomadura harenae TaxID=2483351 RepID=A0A3M2LMX9_9ACTN|nr:DUF397 domain-containing protein [Actinomadura harenae]RMI37883.1 DUF397 domain-containing protein [Actinomadura harenae]
MTRWRKSSYSNDYEGSCVELAGLGLGEVGLRDSKAPDAGHVSVSTAELGLLLERVRSET